MKKRMLGALALGATCALLLSGCQSAEGTAPEGTAAEGAAPEGSGSFQNLSDLDIVEELVATTPPTERIRYDENPLTYGNLRLPDGESDEGFPLVIILHGGQWESSYTLDYMGPLAQALTDAGFATWNLEFRRLNNPGGGYPGTFLDAANGVDYAAQLAEEYPIDLDRVVLMGHSSGGHLATWATGRTGIPSESPLYTEDPLPVRGVVDLAGVLDFEYAYDAGRDDLLTLLDAADRAELAEKSVHASSINLLPMGVPQTLIIGTQDSPWRLESQERYQAAGSEGGDTIELVTLDGANHFDVVDPCSPAWSPTVTAVFEQVDEPLDEDATSLNANICGGD